MQTKRHLESAVTRRSAAAGAMALVGLLVLPVSAQTPSGITGVVAPGVEPVLVQEGFVFTEGPVGTPDGGLYFSDIRPNRIYRLDTNGEINLFREQTNGANGLAVTREGDLLAAEGDGKRISNAAATAPSRPLPRAAKASRFWRRTISSLMPWAASTSPIPARGRLFPAALPTSITCRPAPSSRSWCR